MILPPLVFPSLTYNQYTILNFQQDVVASMHDEIFHGETDMALIYLPNHSGETRLSYQEEQREDGRSALMFLANIYKSVHTNT